MLYIHNGPLCIMCVSCLSHLPQQVRKAWGGLARNWTGLPFGPGLHAGWFVSLDKALSFRFVCAVGIIAGSSVKIVSHSAGVEQLLHSKYFSNIRCLLVLGPASHFCS